MDPLSKSTPSSSTAAPPLPAWEGTPRSRPHTGLGTSASILPNRFLGLGRSSIPIDPPTGDVPRSLWLGRFELSHTIVRTGVRVLPPNESEPRRVPHRVHVVAAIQSHDHHRIRRTRTHHARIGSLAGDTTFAQPYASRRSRRVSPSGLFGRRRYPGRGGIVSGAALWDNDDGGSRRDSLPSRRASAPSTLLSLSTSCRSPHEELHGVLELDCVGRRPGRRRERRWKEIGSSSKKSPCVCWHGKAVTAAARHAPSPTPTPLTRRGDAVVVIGVSLHKSLWDVTTREHVGVLGSSSVVGADLSKWGRERHADLSNLPDPGPDFDSMSEKVRARIRMLVTAGVHAPSANLRKIQLPVPRPTAAEDRKRLALQHVEDLISMSNGQVWLDAEQGRSPPRPVKGITVGVGADTTDVRADAPALRSVVGSLRFEFPQVMDLTPGSWRLLNETINELLRVNPRCLVVSSMERRLPTE
ncbi:hypothetical protein ACHAW5_003827 [Stephanodiscus triporus]|uniref:Uncharacterized protein n=1 Tax=Stephanodiscus triporus TaxID=2934178 RepID=A0ABD3R0B2_9STRA